MTFQSTACQWESRVMRAAQAAGAQVRPERPADHEVTAHLAGCAGCRDLFEVAETMARLAEVSQEEFATRRLPAAGQLWWKAQLMQRWEAEARATAPVDLMQRAEVVGGVLAGLALLVTLWPDVAKLQAPASTSQEWWITLARFAEPANFSSVIVGGVAVLGLLAFVTVRQLFTED